MVGVTFQDIDLHIQGTYLLSSMEWLRSMTFLVRNINSVIVKLEYVLEYIYTRNTKILHPGFSYATMQFFNSALRRLRYMKYIHLFFLFFF